MAQGDFSFGASANPQGQSMQRGSDPWAQLMQLLPMLLGQNGVPQGGGNNVFGQLLDVVRPDKGGDANRRSGLPSYNTDAAEASPFLNGFFDDKTTRMADMQNRTGAYAPTDPARAMQTVLQMQAAGLDPGRRGIGNVVPEPTGAFLGPSAIPQNLGAEGYAGVINPTLPDAQKFQEPNIFSVMPGVTGSTAGIPENAFAWDGGAVGVRGPAPQPPSGIPFAATAKSGKKMKPSATIRP